MYIKKILFNPSCGNSASFNDSKSTCKNTRFFFTDKTKKKHMQHSYIVNVKIVC